MSTGSKFNGKNAILKSSAGLILFIIAIYMIIYGTQDHHMLEKYVFSPKSGGDGAQFYYYKSIGTFNQPFGFVLAGWVMLISSIFFVLYSNFIAQRKLILFTWPIVLIGAVLMNWFNYDTLKTDIDFAATKEKKYNEIKQMMEDVKDAQLAFKEVKDRYAVDFNELIGFVKNDSIPIPIKKGNTPARSLERWEADSLGYSKEKTLDNLMTEKEAIFLYNKGLLAEAKAGKFLRDTTYEHTINRLFANPRYKQKRKRLQLEPLHIDSLGVKYYSNGEMLKMVAVNDSNSGSNFLMIIDPKPFDIKDTLRLGDTKTNNLKGNW